MLPEVAAALMQVAPVVVDALTKGVSKETLIETIKQLMTDISDAEMRREFPEGGL